MVKPVFINKRKEKEKEPEKEKENNIEFLSKKRAEPDTPKEEIDMIKLKKKVNEIMYDICNEANNSSNDFDVLYEKMNKNYLMNEFTNNCLNYINKIIINTEKNHLKKFQGIFELNRIFISIIKELLMNEFELLLLSLYLESVNIAINDDIKSFKESLIFICYFIKKLTLTGEKLSPINSFLNRKYQGFDDKFDKWFESNSSIFNNKLYFSYAEINQRYKEFNKPYSIFCKNNYLDYNLIIDRILTMSIPYNESKGENHTLNKKSFINSNDINNSLNNSLENTNNINYNQTYLLNNTNTKKNFFPNYIQPYQGGIFLNQNNLGCLYNNNPNILYQLNQMNPGQINPNANLIKKETPNQNLNSTNEQKKNKGIIKFISIKEDKNNNSNNSNQKNEVNDNNINPKVIFMTQTPINSTESKNDNETGEEENKKINVNQNNDKAITPNTLLYSLEQDNSKNFNNNSTFYKQAITNNINSINLNNNNINKNNNNAMNILQNNNILGLNLSQPMNDFNPLKYSPNNIGINEINSQSQLSLLSFKNPCYVDLNQLYNSYFQGIDGEQLYNQSRENFFKSCLSINAISSSKNFYPNLNGNFNFNNNTEKENIKNNININNNNNYSTLKNILIGNSILPNLNNISQNNNKENSNENNNNLTIGKNGNEITNKNGN